MEIQVRKPRGRARVGRPLELRLLGELQLAFAGREVALPASKKTRALLAYLVATGRPHRREWLCDLLWEGPDDPRGELRWSLAKIRPLLDLGGAIRLKTDRSRVAFEPHGAVVDLTTVRDRLGDIPKAPIEVLQDAVALFRGEFLDGIELPACYRFQQWCLAERAAISTLRLAALRGLVERLGTVPKRRSFTRAPWWWRIRCRKMATPASCGFSRGWAVGEKPWRNTSRPGTCLSAKSARRSLVR